MGRPSSDLRTRRWPDWRDPRVSGCVKNTETVCNQSRRIRCASDGRRASPSSMNRDRRRRNPSSQRGSTGDSPVPEGDREGGQKTQEATAGRLAPAARWEVVCSVFPMLLLPAATPAKIGAAPGVMWTGEWSRRARGRRGARWCAELGIGRSLFIGSSCGRRLTDMSTMEEWLCGLRRGNARWLGEAGVQGGLHGVLGTRKGGRDQSGAFDVRAEHRRQWRRAASSPGRCRACANRRACLEGRGGRGECSGSERGSRGGLNRWGEVPSCVASACSVVSIGGEDAACLRWLAHPLGQGVHEGF